MPVFSTCTTPFSSTCLDPKIIFLKSYPVVAIPTVAPIMAPPIGPVGRRRAPRSPPTPPLRAVLFVRPTLLLIPLQIEAATALPSVNEYSIASVALESSPTAIFTDSSEVFLTFLAAARLDVSSLVLEPGFLVLLLLGAPPSLGFPFPCFSSFGLEDFEESLSASVVGLPVNTESLTPFILSLHL